MKTSSNKMNSNTQYFMLTLLTLLTCTFIILNGAEKINRPHHQTFRLKDHMGLHYNQIGKAKLSNARYTLLTHINLTISDQKYDILFKSYTRSLAMCAYNSKHPVYESSAYFCQSSFENIHSRIMVTKNKIEIIKSMTDDRSKIVKRGLFDGASHALHWLFDTNAEDAKFYKEAIDSIVFKTRDVHLLLKQQITIISNTIQNFNSSIQRLRADENKVNENIKLFNSFSNSTTNYLNNILTRYLILEQLFSLTQMLAELDEHCNLIISSISLAGQNILLPQMVSPQTLFHEMSNIVLQNGLKWPIELTYSNMHKYERLYVLNAAYINNMLVFIIKIPLVEEMQYELYELLPLPVSYNASNTYLYIKPSFPYMLLSVNEVYYSMLPNLEACTIADIEEHICFVNHVTRTTGQPTCETTLFTTNTRRIPPTCQVHTIKGNFEKWYYVQNNEWIFAASYPLRLTLTCSPTHIEDVELETTGIIRLEPQCKGYTETTILEPVQGITINQNFSFPMNQIFDEDCCLKPHENSTIIPIQLKPIKITNVNTEEFKLVNHRLIQMDNLLQKEMNKPVIVQHNYWYSSAMNIIIFIIAIIFLVQLLRWCGVLRLVARLLHLRRNPRSPNDSCCFKIINTNINAGPVTRKQLSALMEEDRLSLQEETSDLLSSFSDDDLQPNDSRSTPIGQSGLRRSTFRAPSVNMD